MKQQARSNRGLDVRTLLIFGLLLGGFVLAAVGLLGDLVSRKPTPSAPAVPRETSDVQPDGSVIARGVDFERNINPGGSSGTSTYYSSPVNFLDRDGKYKPIKTAIAATSPTPGYDYSMTTNRFHVFFKKVATEPDAIRFELDGKRVSYTIGNMGDREPKPVEAKVEGSTLTYPGIYDGVDLRYTVSNTALVEEYVVFKPYDAKPITQTVRLSGADLHGNEDGSVTFLDPTSRESLWIAPAPLMYEDRDRFKVSDGLSYEVQSSGAEYILTRTFSDAGKNFLAKAKYPVAIDATVTYLPSFASNKAYKISQFGGGTPQNPFAYTSTGNGEFATTSGTGAEEYADVTSDDTYLATTPCSILPNLFDYCLAQHNFRFSIAETAADIAKLRFTFVGRYEELDFATVTMEARVEVRTDDVNNNRKIADLTTTVTTTTLEILTDEADTSSPNNDVAGYFLEDATNRLYVRAYVRNLTYPQGFAANYTVFSDLVQVQVVWVKPPTSAAFRPGDFVQGPGGGRSVVLEWRDNSANETGWKVYRSIDGVSYSQIGQTTTAVSGVTGGDPYNCTNSNARLLGTTAAGTGGWCTYTDLNNIASTVLPDAKYYYRVSTLESGTSDPSPYIYVQHPTNGSAYPYYAYSLANTPAAPTLANGGCGGAQSLAYVVNPNGNPTTPTQYLTRVSFAAQTKYTNLLFAGCSPNADELIDAPTYRGYSATGFQAVAVQPGSLELSPNTLHTFDSKARNGDLVETSGFGASSSKYTYIEPPTDPGTEFGTVTDTAINAKASGTFTNLGVGKSRIAAYCDDSDLPCTTTDPPTGWLETDARWKSDTATYHEFTGLTPNTAYNFFSTSRNAEGNQNSSETPVGPTTKYTLAAKPTAVSVDTQSTTNFRVTWQTTNPDGTEYDVLVYTYIPPDPDIVPPPPPVLIQNDNSNWVAFTCTGSPKTCAYTVPAGRLSPNSGYRILVKARNADLIEAESCGYPDQCLQFYYTLAEPPISLDSVSCSYNPGTGYNCVLAWTRPASLPNRYSIWRSSTTPTGACPAVALHKDWNANIPGSASSYTDSTGLVGDTKYCYEVGSYNSQQEDSLTRTNQLSDVTPPKQVVNLTHTANTVNSITWQWDRLVEADTYKIFDTATGTEIPAGGAPSCSSFTGKCTWTQNEHRNGPGPSYNLLPNTQYGIRVVAVSNANGDGQPSADASAYTSIEDPTGVLFGTPTPGGSCGTGVITQSCVDTKAAGNFTNPGVGQTAMQIHRNSPIVADSPWSGTNDYWSTSGLNANTQTSFQARARNAEGDETGWFLVSPQSKYTLAATPSAPTLSREAPSYMVVTLNSDGNDGAVQDVEYAVLVSTDGTNYTLCAKETSPGTTTLVDCYRDTSADPNQPSGKIREGISPGGTYPAPDLWKTKSEWELADGVNDNPPANTAVVRISNLIPKTYTVSLRARNGDSVETDFGPSTQLFLVKNNLVGWLWSSNAGWISLNCLNLKKDFETDPLGVGQYYKCDQENGYYGADVEFSAYRVNPVTGYGWSSQAGWVSFNRNVCSNDTTLACSVNSDCGTGNTCIESSGTPASNDCDVSGTPESEQCGFGYCSNLPTQRCQEGSSTCGAGTCRVKANVSADGVTRELKGWARVLAEKEHGEDLGYMDWGWVEVKGRWDAGGGNTGPYLWSLLDVNPSFLNIVAQQPIIYSVFGWAWDRNVVASDAGYGWIQARGEGNVVNLPFLQTFFRDIYSGGQIRLAPPPRGLTNCGPAADQPCETATYLILASGDIQGISGFYPSTSTGLPTSSLFESSLVPVKGNYPVSPNAIRQIDVNAITTVVSGGKNRFGHSVAITDQLAEKTKHNAVCETGETLGTDCVWTTSPVTLGGKVYDVKGDLTLNDADPLTPPLEPLTFRNDGGAGLVVVDGDLHIRTNVQYGNESLNGKKLTNLGSLGFLVKGNTYIDPGVSSLVGAYVAVGDQSAQQLGEVFTASRGYRLTPDLNGQSDAETYGILAGDWNATGQSITFGCYENPPGTFKAHRAYLRFPIDVPKKVCSNDTSVACSDAGDCGGSDCGPTSVDASTVLLKSSAAGTNDLSADVGILDPDGSGDIDPTSPFTLNPQSSGSLNSANQFSAKVCSNDPLRLCAAASDCAAATPMPTCDIWVLGGRYPSGNAATGVQNFISGSPYSPGSSLGLVLKEQNEASCNSSGATRSFIAAENGGANGKDAPRLVVQYNADGKQLTVNGLLVARRFHFERQSTLNLQPAEQVIYDGRVVANTPPGLEDFAKALPTYQQVVP